MSKKIKDVSQSIKSKLSFDDYQTSTPNEVKAEEQKEVKTEPPKAVKTERSRKVKRTFYILEDVAEAFDEYFINTLIQKKKVDKSDIITQAIKNFIKDENAEISNF